MPLRQQLNRLAVRLQTKFLAACIHKAWQVLRFRGITWDVRPQLVEQGKPLSGFLLFVQAGAVDYQQDIRVQLGSQGFQRVGLVSIKAIFTDSQFDNLAAGKQAQCLTAVVHSVPIQQGINVEAVDFVKSLCLGGMADLLFAFLFEEGLTAKKQVATQQPLFEALGKLFRIDSHGVSLSSPGHPLPFWHPGYGFLLQF